MPERWAVLFEGKSGAVFAALLGAFLRGLVGPGPWIWREFALASLTGVILALWVGPGLAEYFRLGQDGSVALGVVLGMFGLPLVRGGIKLARDFRDDPRTALGRKPKDKD